MLPNVVNRADIGVVQGRGRLGFALETAESLVISGNLFRQEFEGNKTMEPGVFRLVDHTHPAAAQLLNDAVVRNGLADELGGC